MPKMQTILNYTELFDSFKKHLLLNQPVSTKDITVCIKNFFLKKFSEKFNVLCSHSKGNEYLTDILVTDFDPKVVLEKRTFEMENQSFGVYLAAESELGGTGASSAYGVMKNVVEDYLKLLMIHCRYRVMIFTSLPYSDEDNHLGNRVETLRELYIRTSGVRSGMLLIHLASTQPRSTQVQVSVTESSLRAFIVSEDGRTAHEIERNTLVL